MKVDTAPRQACTRDNCDCTVPDGEKYCSDHCRAADTRQSATERSSECACGHDECAAA